MSDIEYTESFESEDYDKVMREKNADKTPPPELKANEGKNMVLEKGSTKYERLPIKTHVITEKDDICDVAEKYAKPHLIPDDILFISEKAVACSQGRAIPLDQIKPRKLAAFLCKYVTKTKHGIGLGIPETMEMALRECGTLRILFAAAISAVGKLFKQKGWFYIIAGEKASSIDGPTSGTIPPYNKCVVLGPDRPDRVAFAVSERVGCRCIIVDINDLGGKILGISDPSLSRQDLAELLSDNPLGQGHQSTPMGIIRALDVNEE